MIDKVYLDKLQEQYELKINKLERNYQDTGSTRTQNTIYKYRDLIEVIRMARNYLNQSCFNCERHRRSVADLIKRYEAYKAQGLKDFEDFNTFINDLKSVLL